MSQVENDQLEAMQHYLFARGVIPDNTKYALVKFCFLEGLAKALALARTEQQAPEAMPPAQAK